MKFVIKYFEENSKGTVIKEKIINERDIKRFGIENVRQYKKDGGFKRFVKNGFVETKKQFFDKIILSNVISIKHALKENSTVNKSVVSERKITNAGFSKKEAINWEYIIKD